jgi:hypothetical protein
MKVLIVGCSLSSGFLFEHGQNDQELWCHKLIKETIEHAEVTNLSGLGRNNDWIFSQTALEIVKNKYDLVLVQWTEWLRFNIHVGLEPYQTLHLLNKNSHDIHLVNDIKVSNRWLSKIGDNLPAISNPHWNLLNQVKWSNILIGMQEKIHKSKIAFVSPSLNIPIDYFQKKNFKFPSELSKFEQDMLSVHLRSDKEIIKLYDMIHQDYQEVGGFPSEYWLTPLNEGLRENSVDYLNDGLHLGPETHTLIANDCIPRLKKILSKLD